MDGMRVSSFIGRACGLGLVLAAVTVSLSHAQPASDPVNTSEAARMHFTHLGTDDGLSSARATAVIQDPAGYVWIGTTNGLDRYDGYAMRAYRNEPQNPASLSNSWIQALYVDRAGNLWVGTAGGVNVYDAHTDSFQRVPSGLQTQLVSRIFQDSAGLMWFATRGSGVYSLESTTKQLTHYVHNPTDAHSLSSDQVQQVVQDPSGTLWIATLAGLDRFDPVSGQFTVYRHDASDPDSLSYDTVWDALVDQSGTLWVGTDGGGLDALDPSSGRFVHHLHDPNDAHSLSGNRVGCLTEDAQGDLIVGTFNSGLSVLDASRHGFSVARHRAYDPSSLVNDTLFGCGTDQSGLVWLATAGGVDIYDPLRQAVMVYRAGQTATDLASDNIAAVNADSTGGIWVGSTDSGFDHIDPHTGNVTHYAVDPSGNGLSNAFVSAVATDQSGAVWIGTLGGGLYRLDPASNTLTAYRHIQGAPSLSDDNVTELLVARTGALWVGTRGGGLDRLDPVTGAFTVYRHSAADPASLGSDIVRSLAEGPSGEIWVGTVGGGLDRLVPSSGSLAHFQHDPANPGSLADNSVYALHVDRAGELWVGFPSAGLDRLQHVPNDPASATFTHYRQVDGLASDEVSSIVEDGPPTAAAPGNLWIATGLGLSRLGTARQTFQTYGSETGLPAAPLTRANAVTPSGKLLFGSVSGLIELDPEGLLADDYVPPIVITGLMLNNQPVVPGPGGPLTSSLDVTDSLEINWDQRAISLEFSALDYRRPGLSRYRYMLEGFDAHWIEVDSSKRVATYTNLDPGTYVFRVTGSNVNGVWNPTGRALTLIVAPPWWATWWFRLVASILLVATIVLIYRWRARTLGARQRALEALVAERTEALQTALGQVESALGARDEFLRTLAHDLKAPLTSLTWNVQVLMRQVRRQSLDVPGLAAGLEAIESGANEAVAAIDELHDLTRLELGEALPLHREQIDLQQFVEQLVTGRGEQAAAQFHVEPGPVGVCVDGDRSRLARALGNVFDNAIKYSGPGGHVLVSVHRDTGEGTEWAVVRVHDGGVGIPADDLPYVFDRYRRGSNVAHTPGEGLGLASVQQLIQSHGGRVAVDSAEGVGTTVTLWLPTARVDSVASTEPSSQPPSRIELD